MFKRYLLIIIAVLIILLVGFYYYFFLKPFSQPEKQEEEKEAVLVIDFGERKRVFAGETIENMTFLDALLASAKAGNFSFNFERNVLKMIDQIEEGEKKWNAYFNREKIDDYLDDVLIKPGDKLELKFE